MPNLIISIICIIVLIAMGVLVSRDVSEKERNEGLVKVSELKSYRFIGKSLYVLAAIISIFIGLKYLNYEYTDVIYIMSLILWFMIVVVVVQLFKEKK